MSKPLFACSERSASAELPKAICEELGTQWHPARASPGASFCDFAVLETGAGSGALFFTSHITKPFTSEQLNESMCCFSPACWMLALQYLIGSWQLCIWCPQPGDRDQQAPFPTHHPPAIPLGQTPLFLPALSSPLPLFSLTEEGHQAAQMWPLLGRCCAEVSVTIRQGWNSSHALSLGQLQQPKLLQRELLPSHRYSPVSDGVMSGSGKMGLKKNKKGIQKEKGILNQFYRWGQCLVQLPFLSSPWKKNPMDILATDQVLCVWRVQNTFYVILVNSSSTWAQLFL